MNRLPLLHLIYAYFLEKKMWVLTAFKILNMMQVQHCIRFNDLHSSKGVKPYKPNNKKTCLHNDERIQSLVSDEILSSGWRNVKFEWQIKESKNKRGNRSKQIGYREKPHSTETKHKWLKRADKGRLQQKRGVGRIQWVMWDLEEIDQRGH